MIVEKYFYTIGETSQLTGVKPHILRYWESQFKLLRPARRYSGHRKFTQKEIDLIHRIRHLILERKFTLAGAKREINRQLGEGPKESAPIRSKDTLPVLKDLKKELEACLEILGTTEKEAQLFDMSST